MVCWDLTDKVPMNQDWNKKNVRISTKLTDIICCLIAKRTSLSAMTVGQSKIYYYLFTYFFSTFICCEVCLRFLLAPYCWKNRLPLSKIDRANLKRLRDLFLNITQRQQIIKTNQTLKKLIKSKFYKVKS